MQGGIAATIWTAIGIAALTVSAGCSTADHQAAKKPGHASPVVNGEDEPTADNRGTRVITNLSQLSSAPSTLPAMNAQNLVNGAASLHDATAIRANDAQSQADRNLDRLYLSKQHSMVHGGEARAAGDRSLLNDKARQFPEFSYAMLDQTLVAAQELEAKQLQDHKLPDQIKPVILVAVMTPEGKLTDISIEQHSGVGSVDRLMIDACKKGLWAMNPPLAARTDDGNYRIRFEGVVNNYSYNLEGDYKYVTHIGLALL
jgi:hypothetical protein